MYINNIIFWSTWILIPLLWEVSINFIAAILLLFKRKKKIKKLDFRPKVSVLVPIFNSKETLEKCIESIATQTYGLNKIEILLLNNGKEDGSFKIFAEKKRKYAELNMWWFNTRPGKSKALNVGIMNASGEYIIHIDSDGYLDKNAIENIVYKFQENPGVHGLTGTVLINKEEIKETKNRLLKLLRVNEMGEYVQSFLLGRNIKSTFGNIYTMAGAFSAFKKSSINKSFLYNSQTVGEDTHMSFQLKSKYKKNSIKLCENAYFYTDPVDNLNHLYTQRKRWQRGQLEVGRLFLDEHKANVLSFFKKQAVRVLVYAHTLAFPRLVWMYGMAYLYIKGYPLDIILISNLFLYLCYVFNGFLSMAVGMKYLKDQPDYKKYLKKHVWIAFTLPLYRLITYLFRVLGVINSTNEESKWTSSNLTEEKLNLKLYVISIYQKYFEKYYQKIEGFLTN